MPLSSASLAMLGACVFLAGFIDALAGGGGLITLPAYLAAGLPPVFVLGTNKLMSTLGTCAATARYHRALKFSWREFAPALALGAAAAWLGAKLAVRADSSWLRPMLLVALPVVGWLVWSPRDFGAADVSHVRSPARRRRREMLALTPVAAYDGFFGPGAGTFYALGLTRLCGYGLVGATGRAKAANLASNAAALLAFIAAGRVRWELGLSMAAASAAGNWTGAHLGVRRGAALIRPAVILVCAGLFAKLFLDAVNIF